jgi:hypothetical protein
MTTTLSAFLLIAFFLVVWAHRGSDDTDGPNGRSGMILYTDHKTRVQYVGTLFGGITPRLDKDGKPVLDNPTE